MSKVMRKPQREYYFSVEGETEQLYLSWLQNQINTNAEVKERVKFDIKVEMNPISRVKGLKILQTTEIVQIFDMEGERESDIKRFNGVLAQMKTAQRQGKTVKFILGYSNLSFELWMLLHKTDMNISLTGCLDYLSYINRLYEERFENLKQYKERRNFIRILGKLSLPDVRQALLRASKVHKANEQRGYKECNVMGYKYYRENPSLSIDAVISRILKEAFD